MENSTDGVSAKAPPYSEDAEQAVLSAMLIAPEAVTTAIDLLQDRMFFAARHRALFRAMRRLAGRQHVIDPLTVADELGPELETAGGKDYLGFLVDAVPTANNVKYHGQIVLEKFAEREVRTLLDSGIAFRDALATFRPTLDALADAERPQGRHRLYSAAELDELPPAEWIADHAIPRNAIVGVIGAKGHLKTFVVLDFALHHATGTEWHGRTVTQGAVVYVYAEGPFGAKTRVESWCQYHSYLHGVTVDRKSLPIWFLPCRLPINSPTAVSRLISDVRRLGVSPSMIVIDTLNQNLDGDEDGAGMGGFANGCATLRDEFDATVMVVHHTPLGAEDRARGHSAFDGVLDTRLIVTRDADRVTLECTHQRNGPDGWSVAFEAIPIAGSLVLKPSALDGGALKGQRRELLDTLHSQGTLTYSAWIAETKLKPSSFRKARTWLLAKAYVRQDGKFYTASDAGVQALGH